MPILPACYHSKSLPFKSRTKSCRYISVICCTAKKCVEYFLEKFLDSTLAKHKAALGTNNNNNDSKVHEPEHISDHIKELFSFLCNGNICLEELSVGFKADVLCSDHQNYIKFYYNKISKTCNECEHICQKTVAQSRSQLWWEERILRITRPICYQLFTYGSRNPDWANKITSLIKPKFRSDNATKHGSEWEKVANDTYLATLSSDLSVKRCGLAVLPIVPWLAFSPDGILFRDNKPEALIEIKCLYKGIEQKKGLLDLIEGNAIPYIIKFGNSGLQLKEKY